MLILEFNNLKNLNASLQVGDAVYAHGTNEQLSGGLQQTNGDTGANQFIGILRKIDDNGGNQYDLHVDNSVVGAYGAPQSGDFIMFSKSSQGNSGVLGYYAEAKFVNDSTEKAELFAVSSEIIINSN